MYFYPSHEDLRQFGLQQRTDREDEEIGHVMTHARKKKKDGSKRDMTRWQPQQQGEKMGGM